MKHAHARATTPFAHLVGGPAPLAESGDDEDAKKVQKCEQDLKKAEDDLKSAQERQKKAEDDGDDDEAKKASEDAKKAEGDVKKARSALKKARGEAEDDDDDDDDDEDDDGDDDSDREEASNPARLRERARCAAIFAHPAAATNVALAAQLAFRTTLPRSEAIGIMLAGGASAPKRKSLAERMDATPQPVVGLDAPSARAGSPEALADRVVSLYRDAKGLKAPS